MPNQTPIEQCAVIAYKRHKQGLKLVLVTSLETRRWVLPKGHYHSGLSARASASAEAYEEAGVEGVVARDCIGHYDYWKTEEKGGGLRRVTVFPMAVSRIKRNWPEKDLRRRKWMTPDEAAKAVNEKQLKKLIVEFARNFDRYRVGNND